MVQYRPRRAGGQGRAAGAVLAVLLAMAALLLQTGSASAITFGQPDGNRHPNVGALLADYDPDSPGPDILCSGTLIGPRVFLTAAHCTAFLESEGISQVWVTFAPSYDGVRRFVMQSPLNLEPSWLLISMQPSTGNGGTCYGDSGGPHFLGSVIVATTITGDAACRPPTRTTGWTPPAPGASSTTS